MAFLLSRSLSWCVGYVNSKAYANDASVGYIIGTYAERKGEAEIGKFTLTLRRAETGDG